MKTTHRLPLETLQQYDPAAAENIATLNNLNLVAVGVVPYPRIVPGLFLDTYQIYSATEPTDVAVLLDHFKINTLEGRFPKEAAKVRAMSYLVGNHCFQKFIASRRTPVILLFSSASDGLVEKLEEHKFPYLAAKAAVSEEFKTKKAFRSLLERLDLPHLPYRVVTHAALSTMSFADFAESHFERAVIQRAEIEVGGNEGTFFIHNETDFDYFKKRTKEETEVSYIISRYIEGDSVSMAGCVTSQGTLTGALQLQLIDVPEALHGVPANGIFYGNDWGYKNWTKRIEKTAQEITEAIGTALQEDGFTGIFGIDFMIDAETDEIFPIECNPRITGSMPAHSLMLLENNIPPFEYYHLLALTGHDTTFDFAAANESLKYTAARAHVSLSPKGIETMRLPLVAGVYAYDEATHALTYKRPGFHYADIESPDEFIIIDTVAKEDSPVQQQVPGFFKFLFNHQIATDTHTLNQRTKKILNVFAHALTH